MIFEGCWGVIGEWCVETARIGCASGSVSLTGGKPGPVYLRREAGSGGCTRGSGLGGGSSTFGGGGGSSDARAFQGSHSSSTCGFGTGMIQDSNREDSSVDVANRAKRGGSEGGESD